MALFLKIAADAPTERLQQPVESMATLDSSLKRPASPGESKELRNDSAEQMKRQRTD
jgi:hypothetical protein